MITYRCSGCNYNTIVNGTDIPHRGLCPSYHILADPEHYAVLLPDGKWATRHHVVHSCPPCALLNESTWRGYRTQAQWLILQPKGE